MPSFLHDLKVEILKRPHPALVHFSLALFPISTVFGFCYYARLGPAFLEAGYWCFLIAAAMTLPISLTGLADAVRLQPHPARAHRILRFHMANGLAATLLSIIIGLYFWIHSPLRDLSLFPLWLLSSVLLSGMVLLQGATASLMVYQHHLGIDGDTR